MDRLRQVGCVGLLCAVVCSAAVVSAQPEAKSPRGQGPAQGQGQGMHRPAFSDYDQNGDGMISKEEFSEARARRVGDRARQGYALRNQDKAPSFEDLDKNGDGEISPREFAEHQQRRR